MSTPEDSSAPARRLRIWTLLRPLLTGMCLVTVYYALPTERGGDVVVLLVGLAALTGLMIWQVRAVMSAPSPRQRAVEYLAISIPLFVVLFASFYANLSAQAPTAFTEPLDRTDALYFTLSVLATVGFGDIAAVSEVARIAVSVQMVTGVTLLGLVIKAFLSAVRIGLQHSSSGAAGRHGDTGRAVDDRTDKPMTAE